MAQSLEAQAEQEIKLKEIKDIVQKAGESLGLQNPVVKIDSLASRIGEGIMGDIFRASLQESTNKPIKVVVKQAPKEIVHRQQALIVPTYKNEINFYSQVYPALKQLETKKGIVESDVPIPQYVLSESALGKEMIVLKDLTDKGFQLIDKNEKLDEEHLTSIFETYGRFHATSFCLKHDNPEEFNRLKGLFTNIWKTNLGSPQFVESFKNDFKNTVDQCIDKNVYHDIVNKLEPYYSSDKNLKEIMLKSVNYEGDYGCILHGDCWSNNMMFKYNTFKKIEAVKFIDFQLAGYGSPVHDLTYFLHVGTPQRIYWQSILIDSYYKSFSLTVQKHGKDPKILLPKEILLDDWKKYSKLSMMLSVIVLKLKFLNVEDTVKLVKRFKVPAKENLGFSDINYNKEFYEKKMRSIIETLYISNNL